MYFFFFFQAEDGIRDVERSRGLGDVYKRQVKKQAKGSGKKSREKAPKKIFIVHEFKKIFNAILILVGIVAVFAMIADFYVGRNHGQNTVSYTHLTLPTILLVQISVAPGSLKKKK
eukprot:TRINITY_DN71568_c0_g1_i1.p1 TRINITY_DN71568_c0_g1~~TRINITY_DN71568_c0_g1_i1.p1  ORF type:complete len:116 (+),score=44.59 TRINITY_DN71568_c0_g1_i1:38-385(+)